MVKIDIEMPGNCMECKFHAQHNLFDECCITGVIFMDDEDKQRNKSCPLHEVSE